MEKQIRYSVQFNDGRLPANYKGKNSPEFTKELLNIRTYNTFKGVCNYLKDNYAYSTNGHFVFETPCLIKIVTEQIGEMFPVVMETTYTKLNSEATYQIYKKHIENERRVWRIKNPTISADFEELPESVSYFKNNTHA